MRRAPFCGPRSITIDSDAKDADGLEQVARLWTYYAALADGEQPDEGGMRAARLWLDDLAGLMAPILRKQEAVLADVFEAYHAEVAIHARLAAELADVPALRQQLDRLGEEAVAAAARQVADGAALDQLRAEREIRLKALVARNMEVDALRSSLRSTAEERDRLSAEAENAASALATAREQAVELEAHAARAEIASSAFADELRARKAALEQARAALSLVRDSADAARAEFAEAVRRVQDGAIAERASLRAELTAQYAARFAAEGRAAALDEALVCARDADAGARARAESVAAEAARLAAELEAARAMAAVRDAEIARLGGGLLARLRAPFASPDPAG